MKRVLFSMLGLVLVASSLMLTTTSCEKEAGPIPNAIEKECRAGDRPTITFTTGGDWQLSSDALWCKFITSAGELQNMSGPAGTHTVTLKITDEDNGNSWSKANITMKMGGQSGIIAVIKRHPSVLYMKLYDITDTPAKSIKLGYVDWIPFRIEANFRFSAIDFPEWMDIGLSPDQSYSNIESVDYLTGVPGEQTEAYARIKPDGERESKKITEEDGYKIIFSDESGEHTFEFPITYDGMGTDNLTFVGPTESYYGWEVSLDGKTLRYTDTTNNTVTTFYDELEYSITAQDNDYQILYFEKRIERGIPTYEYFDETSSSTWMHFNKESMTLTIDEHSGTPRHGMVMALPRKTFNTIRTSIIESLFESDASSGIALPVVKNEYAKYILIEFTQCDLSEQGKYDGMYIYHSLTTLEISAVKIEDNSLAEKYGTEEIYRCDFVNPVPDKRPGIIIDPRIEHWTTENYEGGNATAEVWYNDEKLKISEDEYYIGENNDEVLAVHLWGPKEEFIDNVYVVFKYGSEAKKLLVVTPPTK